MSIQWVNVYLKEQGMIAEYIFGHQVVSYKLLCIFANLLSLENVKIQLILKVK